MGQRVDLANILNVRGTFTANAQELAGASLELPHLLMRLTKVRDLFDFPLHHSGDHPEV